MLKKNVGRHLINEPVVVPTQDGSQPEPNENYMMARSTWTRATSFVPVEGNRPVILMGGELDSLGNMPGLFDTATQDFFEVSNYDWYSDRGAKYVGQPGGDHQMPFRPLPGIKDISIEYKGGGMTLGATRTAEINWTCWTWEELDRLMQHFLAHGKTVFLEWGWAGNTTSLKDAKPYPLFERDLSSEPEAYIFNMKEIGVDEHGKTLSDKVPEYILKQNGHYDAMLGVIQNFTWSVRDDGGFDCVTTLVCPGMNALQKQFKSTGDDNMTTLPLLVEPMAGGGKDNVFAETSIKVNSTTLSKTATPEENWDGDITVGALEEKIRQGKQLSGTTGKTALSLVDPVSVPNNYFRKFAPYVNFRNYIADLPKQLEGNWFFNSNTRETGTIIQVNNFSYGSSASKTVRPGRYWHKEASDRVARSEMYCTWGWFEDNVLSRFFGHITVDEKVQGIFRSLDYKYDEETGEVLKELKNEEGEVIDIAYPQSVKIRSTDKLHTVDTQKWLLIRNDALSEKIKENVYYTYDDLGIRRHELPDGKENIFERLPTPLTWRFSPNKDDPEDATKYGICNKDEGFIRNVYFHGMYLANKMMQANTMEEAIMSVWNEFATAYGGVHQFKIEFEDDGNHIVIRDTGQQGDSVINLIEQGKTNRRKEDGEDGDMNGLFEFPIWEDGSIVKSQDLSAKLPGRMQMAAMYGSQNVDTSQKESQRNNEALAGEAWGKLFSPDPEEDDEQTLGDIKRKKYQDMVGGKTDFPTKHNRSFGRADANPITSLHVGDGGGDLDTPKDGTIVYPTIFNEIFAGQSIELQKKIKASLEGEEIKEKAWYEGWFSSEAGEAFEHANLIKAAKESWMSGEAFQNTWGTNNNYLNMAIYDFEKQEAASYTTANVKSSWGTLKMRPEFSAVMKSYFRGDVEGIANKTDPLVPVELSIDIDGTGGIFPGNAFQSSYLPQRYRDVACFQVVGASHKVDSTGWTTTIKGQIRVGLRKEELIDPDIPSTSEWYDSKSEEEKTEYKIDVGAPDAFDGTPTTIIIPAGTPEGEDEVIVVQPITTPEEMEKWEDERDLKAYNRDLKAYNEVTPGTDEYKEITERYIRNIRRDDDHWEADNLLSWANTADSSGKGTGNEFLSYMMANQKNTSIFPQEWFSGDHHEIGIGYNNWLDSISINTPGD